MLLTPLPGKVGRGSAVCPTLIDGLSLGPSWRSGVGGRGESSCLGSAHLPSCHPLSHLHEGSEERVIVLLLPGVSHGLLHPQAVLDIGLEPLADLEGGGWVRGEQVGKEGHEILALAAEHGDQGVQGRVGVETASHRPLVQLLPIPTSHDCQPFSGFQGGVEDLRGRPTAAL